jgi:hypothetical protein
MSGKIDHYGMWTWGGRVFNWKKYLDHMRLSGMDTVVLWHYHAPANAPQIKEYANHLGIRVIWGFNWSWNSPVCLNSDEDAAKWRDIVLNMLKNEYESLQPEGICFQVGGTEFDFECRLGCPICRKTYGGDGVGSLYMKFAGTIIDAVKKQYPELKLYANIHLGGVHQSFEALKFLDTSINIMWEDLPGPKKHLEVPFAYDWEAEDTAVTSQTLNMVRRMCELRGADEDVAFIVKGFPNHWGGCDPMLLEDFDLKVLANVYQEKWDAAEHYCEKRLPDALQVFRIIADSPAREKTVLLLVEHGLWEYQRYYPAMLILEAIKNPFRDPDEVIYAAKSYKNT